MSHTESSSASAALRRVLRSVSTTGGFLCMYACSIFIVKADGLSMADVAFWIVVAAMGGAVLAGFAIAPEELRAAAADAIKRYLMLLGAVGVLGWLSAHGLRALLA